MTRSTDESHVQGRNVTNLGRGLSPRSWSQSQSHGRAVWHGRGGDRRQRRTDTGDGARQRRRSKVEPNPGSGSAVKHDALSTAWLPVAGGAEGFASGRIEQWWSSLPTAVAQGDLFILSVLGKRVMLGGLLSDRGGKRALGQSGRENFSTGPLIFSPTHGEMESRLLPTDRVTL
jgi:hypothetical protein